jgi:dTDP-4-dehydrorhamnose reductase
MKQRILVLGASGMLGHKLTQRLSREFPTFATLRQDSAPSSSASKAALKDALLLFDLDATRPNAIERALEWAEPTVVVNAIGIIKQIAAAKDPISQIELNALLPHRIASACRAANSTIRVIHFSTDCVFSGRAGPYAETSLPDPEDVYGRSKLLGELLSRRAGVTWPI